LGILFENNKIDLSYEFIADESIRFFVPIFPQDVEVDMYR
jgi:hypothetical protein